MKTTTKITFIALMSILLSFRNEINKTQATVEIKEGISIFAYSKPSNNYDVIGSVKVTGIVSSSKAPNYLRILIEKAVKDFPSAEAIIINSEFDKAEVIKFK